MKNFFLAIALMSLFTSTAMAGFADVSEKHPYHKSITWLEEQKVVEGYKDNTFKPAQGINRAEFLKMLYESTGGTDTTTTGFNKFDDVPATSWYTKYVVDALNSGVVEGYPDGLFRPEGPINRAEAIKIVTKYFFDDEASNFADQKSELELLEIMGCNEQGNFLSDIELKAWYATYVLFAHDKCLIPQEMIQDNQPPNDDLIIPDKLLTRGEMAELLYRTKAVNDRGTSTFSRLLVPNNANE